MKTKYKIGDIVLVRSRAGDVIPNTHVRLLERIVVKETKGKYVGMRRTMDWPGYSGWNATPVLQWECDDLRKNWSIPFASPGEDITFVYDDCIVKKVSKLPEKKKQTEKKKLRKKRRYIRK